MRSRTPADLAGRCHRCYLPTRLCLCEQVPRLNTRTEFILIRHHKEKAKSTNTARIAALALVHCQLLPYGAPDDPFDGSRLALPDTWLLFPGTRPAPAGAPPPKRLVVVDGNWSQARRMVHRVPALRALPTLALPPPGPDTRRLRRPPHPEGMSTLEAIAGALALLEGEEAARPLYALNERMIDAVLESRGRLGW
ncbi:MAG TPA: tRNA-uridine aminocarboxypropyltransferase [Myxococcaceae bacterium]|nr:tRNA-uridine aminocarboxypropyltransferase [Myxococcaceae bacterium]